MAYLNFFDDQLNACRSIPESWVTLVTIVVCTVLVVATVAAAVGVVAWIAPELRYTFGAAMVLSGIAAIVRAWRSGPR